MINNGAFALIDSFTGIADGCRTLPLDPGGPAVFQVTVRMGDTHPYLGLRGDLYNSGAGLDDQSARDAGLGEAIERYCLSAVIPDRLMFGTWRELRERGLDPLQPSEVALFDPSLRELGPRVHFEESTALSWLSGVSLVSDFPRLVPACLAHIPYAPVHEGEQLIAPAISTGCACGSTQDKAVFSGLLESIERDAVAIVWRNALPMPRLVIDEPAMLALFEERFARPGLTYHLFVLELDIPLPPVISIVEDRNFDPPVMAIGGACRLDVRDALLKALIESVQGWAWARYYRLKEGPRERPDYKRIDSFEERVRLYACCDMSDALSFLLGGEECRPISAFPPVETREPAAAIPDVVKLVSDTGSDVILLDMTTDDIRELGLHVVRVVCPALEQIEGDHNFQLLGGQRWRQVPVQIGRRAIPLDPEQVNRHPHPYP